MKILLITAYFPPDNGSAAHLFHDLAINLNTREHEITVITTIPQYHPTGNTEKYKRKLLVKENINGINILRIYCPRFEGIFKFGRGLWQVWASIALSIAAICVKRHHISLTYSPPLPLCLAGLLLKKLKKTKCIVNVQDLVPQSIIDLGLLTNPSLISIFDKLENTVYSHADHITVMSEGNRNHVISIQKNYNKVSVVENWINVPNKHINHNTNTFRQTYNITEPFIILFGGVLGYSQDLDVIIQAARLTIDRKDILWLIIGDGTQKQHLADLIEEHQLTNIKLLPMMPREEYNEILSASTIGLATLKQSVKTPVIPSKIYNCMAFGKPIICMMDPSGDAPKLVTSCQCGISLKPGDAEALAENTMMLVDEPEVRLELSENGIGYIKNHLNIQNSTLKSLDIFKNLIENK